jgi:WD40 repeat protein
VVQGEIGLDISREERVSLLLAGFSMLLAVVFLAVLVAALTLDSSAAAPSGVIGYRIDDTQTWVTADGAPSDVTHEAHVGEEHIGLGAVTGAVPWEFPAPDGRSLAYLDPAETSSLYVWNHASVRLIGKVSEECGPELIFGPKEQAAIAGGVPLIVSWAPGSDMVAWGSINGRPESLHVTAADASWTLTFALNEGWVGEAVWSPDGRYLAVSSYDGGQHGLYVLDTRDWSLTKILDGCHIAWSPDSRWIVVHRDPGTESGVWTVNVADPDERFVIAAEKNAFPLGWFPG